jgi:hypothetical protein
MSGFTFGDPRFPTCCGRPQGCTNTDADQCPFWNHRSKRTNDPDHPNHIPSAGKDRDDMSETERKRVTEPELKRLWFSDQATGMIHDHQTGEKVVVMEDGTEYATPFADLAAPAGDSGGERG